MHLTRLRRRQLPKLSRVNLAQVVLQLKGMGIHDPRSFDFLTKPSDQALIKAFKQLYALQALDDKMDFSIRQIDG